MEIKPILIFRSEIAYIYFVQRYLKLKASSKGTRSLLLKSAERTYGFINLHTPDCNKVVIEKSKKPNRN